MKFQVQLTARAEQDLEQILSWFQDQQATTAGARWVAMILKQIDTLEHLPERCPLAAEADDVGIELRELLFGKRLGKYRILFVVRKQVVSILHIRHASRDVLSREDIH